MPSLSSFPAVAAALLAAACLPCTAAAAPLLEVPLPESPTPTVPVADPTAPHAFLATAPVAAAGLPASPRQAPVRSVDGGRTWTPLASWPAGARAGSFATTPRASGVIWVLEPEGDVIRSLDGGASWIDAGDVPIDPDHEIVSPPAVHALDRDRAMVVDERQPNWPGTLCSRTIGRTDTVVEHVLHVTRDGGTTWPSRLRSTRTRIVEAGAVDVAGGRLVAVVGTRARQTPTFSSRLATVEINPTWSVPAKLASEDILPAIRRNPNYLEEHNIRVLAMVDGRMRQISSSEIDWESHGGRNLPFRFRQDPGAGNSLGKVKMMLPNDEAIYLHDTPKRSLFQRTARAYSSGCIRLEKPDLFANLLLTEGAGWSQEQIDGAFAQRGTRAVPLRDSLPVHIAYLTAWVEDDGKLTFHDDIYSQDERIAQMVQARKPLPAPPPADRLRTASAKD